MQKTVCEEEKEIVVSGYAAKCLKNYLKNYNNALLKRKLTRSVYIDDVRMNGNDIACISGTIVYAAPESQKNRRIRLFQIAGDDVPTLFLYENGEEIYRRPVLEYSLGKNLVCDDNTSLEILAATLLPIGLINFPEISVTGKGFRIVQSSASILKK